MNDIKKMFVNHDWYHQYSDDHRWFQAGQRQLSEIRKLLDELEGTDLACPFSLDTLRRFVHKDLSEEKTTQVNAWFDLFNE